jgi:hypothetical protein
VTVGRAATSRAAASLAAVLVAAAAFAPTNASADPAAAEALFREGRRLLEEGKTDEACSKLAASYAEEASSGTLLNLALCHETQHKIATAWSEYVVAAQRARDQGKPDRAAVAENKAVEIERRLPHLTITATAPDAGLQITRGGERLSPGALGSAVPVDPGAYVITATAPGRRAWTTTVDLAEGEAKAVEIPELEPESPPPPVATVAESAPAPPPIATTLPSASMVPAPATTAAASPSGGGRPTLGWIIGGAGVAALGVGAGFGIASLVNYHDASKLCPAPHQECSNDALSARNGAEWMAWVSNVALGAGVIAAGLGTWMLLSGGHAATETETHVGVQGTPDARGARVSVDGTF